MTTPSPRRYSAVRLVVAAGLPLGAAALLLYRRTLDVRWQEPVAHLWLVGAAAVAGAVVAVVVGEAGNRRSDARLFLLALAFASSAVFLGLHAVATPGVLVNESNNGFEAAVPAGLAVAAALAAASTVDLDDARSRVLLRKRGILWAALGVVAVGWAAFVLTGSGPLADPPGGGIDSVTVGLGATGTGLFAFAALRYLNIGSARGRARLLASFVVALVLLADALVVVQAGRNWHLIWWEWHLLMGAAFVVVAATMSREWRREGGRAGLFDSLAMERTLSRVRADYAAALEDLVGGIERLAADRRESVGPLVDAVARRFDLTDRQARLLEEAAKALGENRRLYAELDTLFRSYLSPDVAEALVAQPDRAALGGAIAEITVLHADLASFTTFSEEHEPAVVVDMLNTYFGAVVPPVLRAGGTVTQFVGDAMMAVFGAPASQPDHAARACSAALELLDAAHAARGDRSWPRFRVGIATGRALVGNVGSDALRSFTAIGDIVNVAARLESVAPVGGVLVSEVTVHSAGEPALTIGEAQDLTVKGKKDPVRAYRLTGVKLASG